MPMIDVYVGVVKEITEIVAAAAGDPELTERTWVLLTESPEGGWGVAGHHPSACRPSIDDRRSGGGGQGDHRGRASHRVKHTPVTLRPVQGDRRDLRLRRRTGWETT
jgi:phenylpyruvate tautomerase PptA (4-oxalocrotonate tautomerase family)